MTLRRFYMSRHVATLFFATRDQKFVCNNKKTRWWILIYIYKFSFCSFSFSSLSLSHLLNWKFWCRLNRVREKKNNQKSKWILVIMIISCDLFSFFVRNHFKRNTGGKGWRLVVCSITGNVMSGWGEGGLTEGAYYIYIHRKRRSIIIIIINIKI